MAQIVTITNPLTGQPAQVDQLEHTAQEIDDAIARALPGGDIDTLLAGKAPAGYGLGETLPTADANEYSGTGFFNSVVNSPTAPQRWTILQIQLVLGDVVRKDQLAFRAGSTFTEIAVRKYTNEDGFTPWEWVNPPMKLGGIDADGNSINEYRTTERYMGKPVYVKLVDFGALPNATEKAMNFPTKNNAQLLECKGFVSGGGVLPYSYPGSSVGTANVFTNKSSGSFGVIVSTDKDMSGKSAYFILKYTKTTD